MDPNACLDRIKAAAYERDAEELRSAQADLREWVAKDGFEPSDPNWRNWLS